MKSNAISKTCLSCIVLIWLSFCFSLHGILLVLQFLSERSLSLHNLTQLNQRFLFVHWGLAAQQVFADIITSKLWRLQWKWQLFCSLSRVFCPLISRLWGSGSSSEGSMCLIKSLYMYVHSLFTSAGHFSVPFNQNDFLTESFAGLQVEYQWWKAAQRKPFHCFNATTPCLPFRLVVVYLVWARNSNPGWMVCPAEDK